MSSSDKINSFEEFEVESEARRRRALERQSERRIERLAAEMDSAGDVEVDMEKVRDDVDHRALYLKNARRGLKAELAAAARREAEAKGDL